MIVVYSKIDLRFNLFLLRNFLDADACANLKAELAESRPDLLRYLSNQVPSMYSKAYRWVAELDEIASFVGDDHAEHDMLTAAARLYERLADDVEGKKTEIGALDRFLKS